ncbi:MAG: class I SAM-dependent rRNA methyltransferase [bacterium]|nr:class I SAM-dependent rRNA methyltransferase [bacterium]
MNSHPQLFLDSRQARNFDGRHPWVLQRSVVEPTVSPETGEIVELLQPNGSWIGRGIYNAHSRIRIRLYQWIREQVLDADWLAQQLEAALRLRETWMSSRGKLDAVRLVNSEGDGLSGLIVDKFGDYLTVQLTAFAMYNWRSEILQWLEKRLQPAAIHVSMDARIAKQEGLEAFDEWVAGMPPSGAVTISENGVRLSLDLQAGQKTGYYLDQRANRQAAAAWIRQGRMLDVCCYHGGFSLAACASNGPTDVVAVDSSEPALQIARHNAASNGFSQIQFQQADCFDILQQFSNRGERFDSIVLDPPRMASRRQQLNSALRAYHRLNLSALQILNADGTLVTCSCSGSVTRDDLWGVLSSAAKRSRRRVQILEARGADVDHPVDVNCPESDYLKCFICRVE